MSHNYRRVLCPLCSLGETVGEHSRRHRGGGGAQSVCQRADPERRTERAVPVERRAAVVAYFLAPLHGQSDRRVLEQGPAERVLCDARRRHVRGVGHIRYVVRLGIDRVVDGRPFDECNSTLSDSNVLVRPQNTYGKTTKKFRDPEYGLTE